MLPKFLQAHLLRITNIVTTNEMDGTLKVFRLHLAFLVFYCFIFLWGKINAQSFI